MRNLAFASAAELKAYRAAAGWTQRELAQRSGFHVQAVKYHEARKGPINGIAPMRFKAAFAESEIHLAPERPQPLSSSFDGSGVGERVVRVSLTAVNT